MTIFITGATGYIGGSIATRLVAAGHVVRGLVRTPEKVEQLARTGVQPVLGSLDDVLILTREASAADAVINAADSDHSGAVETLINALAGSDKPLLHTSGSSIVSDNAHGDIASTQIFDDHMSFVPAAEKVARWAIDRLVIDAGQRGIRAAVLCNTMVYGIGTGLHRESVQIPRLMNWARKSGTVRYIGRGANIWSNVHIEDVADLYLAALQHRSLSGLYFVENGEASFRQIGEAIALRLGLGEPRSWPFDEAAEELGHVSAAYTFGSNSRVRAVRARSELGWRPKHPSLIEWIKLEG